MLFTMRCGAGSFYEVIEVENYYDQLNGNIIRLH